MTNFDESLQLKSGVILPNRLVMAPMTTVQSFYDGIVTTDEINYYKERAQGLGAVITGAANVQAIGKGWPGELSIANDQTIGRLHELATAIQSQGAKAVVQIFHGGRMTHQATLSGQQPVSASAIAAERPDAEVPRELATEEIQETINAFGEATRRAIEAGFDGVELHGANTYLLQQFFSPHSNRRTDEWGGTLEKRYHFIDEVVKSVFSAVAKYADRSFIVGYRLSPEEYETPGIRFEDTLFLLDKLKQFDLDYIHVSLGDRQQIARSEEYGDKPILSHVHERLAGEVPLIGVGGVRNRSDVAEVLGNAELAAVGQQLLVDPSWPLKLANHQDDQMVTESFKEAIHKITFTVPLFNYLAKRY